MAEDEKETNHLEALEGADSRLRLFQIDLLDYDSLAAAINGCAGVFHLASPCSVDQVHDPQVCAAFLNPITTIIANFKSGLYYSQDVYFHRRSFWILRLKERLMY